MRSYVNASYRNGVRHFSPELLWEVFPGEFTADGTMRAESPLVGVHPTDLGLTLCCSVAWKTLWAPHNQAARHFKKPISGRAVPDWPDFREVFLHLRDGRAALKWQDVSLNTDVFEHFVARNNLGPLPPFPDGTSWPILGDPEREAGADKIDPALPRLPIDRGLDMIARGAVRGMAPAPSAFTALASAAVAAAATFAADEASFGLRTLELGLRSAAPTDAETEARVESFLACLAVGPSGEAVDDEAPTAADAPAPNAGFFSGLAHRPA